MFTFIPNMLASAITLVIYFILMSCNHNAAFVNSHAGRLALMAIAMGFNANLSTVSSFINEASSLRQTSAFVAYRYVVVTLLGGQIIGVCILIPFYTSTACSV